MKSTASRRAAGGGEGSTVTDRTIAQLLTEMDGVQELLGVVVLAATNRKDLVRSALLRAGTLRFLDRAAAAGPSRAARDLQGPYPRPAACQGCEPRGTRRRGGEGQSGADIELACRNDSSGPRSANIWSIHKDKAETGEHLPFAWSTFGPAVSEPVSTVRRRVGAELEQDLRRALHFRSSTANRSGPDPGKRASGPYIEKGRRGGVGKRGRKRSPNSGTNGNRRWTAFPSIARNCGSTGWPARLRAGGKNRSRPRAARRPRTTAFC